MEDDELQAIRAARMAELRGSGSGGASSGGPSAPSEGFGGNAGAAGGKGQEDQAAQQEEMKRQMLSRILDTDARERLSRIGLVKPQKARQITDLLIRMAQQGQIRGRITEDQLIGLLDQVDQASSGDAGKITFTRKKTVQDDDDSDFDL
ncbi:DNA-binding TFAR19-related protein [Moesziomyces antarcticus]|uniref:Related to Programmed cell death protein 5 n=2 Tax=Pseudozyma antarctica TaxID=84753 RepID=A0A5C3FUU1_PSEA2|nr:DNA-binding TFAR19-related protein [Moesziomyces antarcticus]GAK67850.1 DNA-binding TFAR19-related protein [Moesziomyces antarcticus]SPO47129.1 related to Programmed cell death protein 5 [Moesziomyces antarcticus]